MRPQRAKLPLHHPGDVFHMVVVHKRRPDFISAHFRRFPANSPERQKQHWQRGLVVRMPLSLVWNINQLRRLSTHHQT
jgi:hypothetical protein